MANETKMAIGEEPITIPAAQFSWILVAAVHCEYLMKQKHLNEEKICRMRAELTRYQTICENRKRTSGAGASVEPQQTTTDADESKTDAGALAIESEGRVSGGERAELEALRKERDELRARLESKCVGCNRAVDATANELRIAAAERCIEEIYGILDGVEDGALSTDNIKDIIRAWREAKGAE